MQAVEFCYGKFSETRRSERLPCGLNDLQQVGRRERRLYQVVLFKARSYSSSSCLRSLAVFFRSGISMGDLLHCSTALSRLAMKAWQGSQPSMCSSSSSHNE